MPVLGTNTSPRTNGIYGRGFWVPPGSLDVFRASMQNAANELCEISVFGDSTTSGSCFDPPANSNGLYSWTQRLRANIASAGYPNGGRGVVASNEIAPGLNPDGITAISSITGFAGLDNNGPLLTDSLRSSANGDTVTIQGKGTAIRLLVTLSGNNGGFTYAVDGGAAVTFESNNYGTPASGTYAGQAILAASGLADATHSIVVTNLGGQLVVAPTASSGSFGATGSGANANMADNPQAYDYVVTGLGTTGQTNASNVITLTQPLTGANRQSINVNIANNGAQSYNVYRRNSGVGVYGLLGNIAPSGGAGFNTGTTTYTDTGSVAPNTGTNPPGSNTAARNAANNVVQFVPSFIRATGVVVNKCAISGISGGSYFSQSNANLGNYPAQLLLGLTPGVATLGSGFNYGWQQPEASHPTATRCRLSIYTLGLNDMSTTGATNTLNAAQEKNYISIWARMTRSAGADPLLVIPHYNLGIAEHTGAGEFFEASSATARAMSIPIVDFNEALGPSGQWVTNNVVPAIHANQNAYNREADFLWTNVLLPYITS